MAQGQGTDPQLEGDEGSSNLTAPSISQASGSAPYHALDPVITVSSLREAVDDAMSTHMPSLIKKAVKEVSKTKAKPKTKRPYSPGPLRSSSSGSDDLSHSSS